MKRRPRPGPRLDPRAFLCSAENIASVLYELDEVGVLIDSVKARMGRIPLIQEPVYQLWPKKQAGSPSPVYVRLEEQEGVVPMPEKEIQGLIMAEYERKTKSYKKAPAPEEDEQEPVVVDIIVGKSETYKGFNYEAYVGIVGEFKFLFERTVANPVQNNT